MRAQRVLVYLIALVSAAAFVAPAAPASAWKPATHLFGVEGALTDATDGDGSVAVAQNDGTTVQATVDPTILAALQAHPEAYRAGAIGPDAFPDFLFGEGQIHPDTRTDNDTLSPANYKTSHASQTWEWMGFLWQQAWKPVADPNDSAQVDARLRNIAFALGFVGGHAVGDVWGHSWVNHYAQGVFPNLTDLANGDISVRHVVVEGYADKHRPGFDTDPRQTYAIDSPTGFIADTLILSDFSKSHSDYPLFKFFFSLQSALQIQSAEIGYDLTHQQCTTADPDCHAGFYKLTVDTANGQVQVDVPQTTCTANVFCFDDVTDAPDNKIALAVESLEKQYLDAWIPDITDGLRAWPEVWAAFAQEMFTGGKPDWANIEGAFKDWVLNHFLSMMGLPDIVGEGLFLGGTYVTEFTDWLTSGLKSVLDPIENSFKAAFPEAAALLDEINSILTDTKAQAQAAALDVADDLAGAVLTAGLNLTNVSPAVKAGLDLNNDGSISPTEIINIFREPEDYLSQTALFPAGTRAQIDADMVLSTGSTDPDSGVTLPGGVDDDVNDVFRDYNPDQFLALRDTTTMAKLALLNETGLNQYVRDEAGLGGNGAGLSDLYGPYTPPGVNWYVPNNIALGWMKAIDGEYQFRATSPNNGHSYGTGDMLLWKDCVSRDRVFRHIFAPPVPGLASFDTLGDVPTNITDAGNPSVSISIASGPSVTVSGTTFVNSTTRFQTSTSDAYFGTPDLTVAVRSYASGPQPAYGTPVGADPAPFGVGPGDGPWTVQATGYSPCGAGPEQTQHYTLDSTGPTVTCDAPDGLWHASDVSLSCTASDAGSGLLHPATDASFSLSTSVAAGTETANAATATKSVCDMVGNCTTAGPIAGNKVDRKAPVISLTTPANGAAYVLNSSVTIAFSCADNGSGVASCTGTLANGASLPTSTLGAYSFTVNSADNVGNTSPPVTVSYSITYGVCPLYDPLKPLGTAGSTVPLKVQICDASKTNLSSPSITLTAVTLDGAAPPPNFSGSSNLGYVFRYDSRLGGYVYNVDTKGLKKGTHVMGFTVSGDTVRHAISFLLK